MNSPTKRKAGTSLFGTVCAIVAPPLTLVSLGAFGWFMAFGPYDLVRLDLPEPWLLVVNVGLSMAFFLQHSGMVRKPARRWIERRCGGVPWMSLYSVISSVVLLAVLVLWQGPLTMLWSAASPWRWLIRMLFPLGAVPFLWGAWAMRDSFVKSWEANNGAHDEPNDEAAGTDASGLIQTGIYGYTRHPQYLAALLMIWSHPDLTTDRLAFNILWSGWVVVGAWLEERDLVRQFGQAYRDYRREVPMLLPWPWRVRRGPAPTGSS